MVNNLTPYSVAVGEENIFLTPLFKFIKREKINYNELLKKNSSVDPFGYLVSKCGKCSFKKIQKHKIHSNYDQNNYSYNCTNIFIFSKKGLDTGFKVLWSTNFLTGYRMIYHTLL